jgi:hypothetical protein
MALDPTTKSLIVSKFPEYAATVDSFSAIPGFDSVMQKGYEMATAYGGPGMNIGNVRGTGLGILKNGLKAASTDPVSFVKSAMRDAVYSGDTNLLKSEIQYLQKNNVPIDDIKNTYTTYATEKAQGQANYEAARAAQSKGGGGLFGDIGNFLASIDPSTAISKAATDLFQPIEQAVTTNLAQLDKDLSLSQNAPLIAAIALSVAAPGVGSAIGQQMIAAGLLPAATSAAVATAVGTGVANAALQVAQGKSPEDALKAGVVGAAGGAVGNYLVGDAGTLKNFVTSTSTNLLAGKNPEDAVIAGIASSGAGFAGSTVARETGSAVAGQVAAGTTAGLLTGKTAEQSLAQGVGNIKLDSLIPGSVATVPTEQQVLAGQQDLMNQLAPYEGVTTPAQPPAQPPEQPLIDLATVTAPPAQPPVITEQPAVVQPPVFVEPAVVSPEELQGTVPPFETTAPVDTTQSGFDIPTDIPDTSGFDIPTPTPQTPITGNTGGNMATYDEEMNAPATELQDTTPFNYTPEEQQIIYQLAQEAGGTQNISDAYAALTQAAQQTANQSGLTVGNVLKFFQSNPNLTKGLVTAGVSAAGGLLTNQANVEAARISAQAMRDAAATAAEAQKFRPVGVTTRFGQSQFGFDPTTGQLTSAGYTVSPELKAMQDRIMALSGQGLTEAEKAAGRYAPLTAGAQGLFGLGQQYLGTQQGAPIGQMAQQYMQSQAGQPLTNLGLGYLAKSPEEAASEYMRSQMDLLAPSRERQLSQLQNQLFNTGRGGLSVGGTGMRPGGGQGLRAASPEMEAYYNALAQQDAQLAAGAQQAGQQRSQFGAGLYQQGTGLTQAQQLAGAGLYGQGVGLTQQGQQFGAGLLGSGANLLGAYGQGLTGAYAPFSTGIGVGSSLESLGQAPLDIGAQLGGRSAQAGANVGQSLLQGGFAGARTTQAASGVSPFGTALTRFADSPEAQQALLGMFTGGTEYGTDTRRYNRDTNF